MSEKQQIIIEFGENNRIEKLLYTQLCNGDKAIYYAGYRTATNKANAEIEELRNRIKSLNRLRKQYIEKDKKIHAKYHERIKELEDDKRN